MSLFLTGITSGGNLDNLSKMIGPIADYFDGLMWTFHLPLDEGADYLEKNKKRGRIVYSHWHSRHGVSMSQFLWQGTMKDGDYFVNLDSMERLGVEFCKTGLPQAIETMKLNNIAVIANYGKGLLFRFNEQLEFKGSPHWYPVGLDGDAYNVELPKTAFWNVRSEQRNPFQFVTHYAKYYVAYPAGSNHCLLGLEKNGDPQALFPAREARRLAFRKAMVKREYDLTVDGVQKLMADGLDEEMKEFFRNEKILNDFYRYFHLQREDFLDNHDFKDMVEIK